MARVREFLHVATRLLMESQYFDDGKPFFKCRCHIGQRYFVGFGFVVDREIRVVLDDIIR